MSSPFCKNRLFFNKKIWQKLKCFKLLFFSLIYFQMLDFCVWALFCLFLYMLHKEKHRFRDLKASKTVLPVIRRLVILLVAEDFVAVLAVLLVLLILVVFLILVVLVLILILILIVIVFVIQKNHPAFSKYYLQSGVIYTFSIYMPNRAFALLAVIRSISSAVLPRISPIFWAVRGIIPEWFGSPL